jgi:hypothetical protein
VAALAAAASPQPLTKAAKKNAARRARRQQQPSADAAPAAAADTAPAPACAAPAPVTPSMPQQQQQQQQKDAWVEAKVSKKPSQQQTGSSSSNGMSGLAPLQGQLQQLMTQPMQSIVTAAKAGTALHLTPSHSADADTTSSSGRDQDPAYSSSGSRFCSTPAEAAAAAAAAGPLAALGRDALLEIVCLLGPADVAALGSTCRALAAAVEDGAVWQVMMGKAFPGARLQPSNMTGGGGEHCMWQAVPPPPCTWLCIIPICARLCMHSTLSICFLQLVSSAPPSCISPRLASIQWLITPTV